MENQKSPSPGQQSDELDLGQLLQLIWQGFEKLFHGFLRLFLYVKRNIIKLGILGIIGIAIGFGLNKLSEKRLKTEVIVKPNLESKNYLYDVIDELRANLGAKDTAFFRSLGIEAHQLTGFGIEIDAVGEKKDKAKQEDDFRYLELLEKFENDEIVNDVVRTEILNKSTLNHRISFYYKDAKNGIVAARKLMDYINSNDYFTELVRINKENAEERINQNSNLVKQIDELIDKYSNKIGQNDRQGEGKIVLDNEEKLDITGLLGLKNNLIRDSERKRVEIQNQKEAIRIINFGRPQEVKKSFFGKEVVLIPVLFIGLFFLFSLIKYLNVKARKCSYNDPFKITETHINYRWGGLYWQQLHPLLSERKS